jgi:putative two-component system response regulator
MRPKLLIVHHEKSLAEDLADLCRAEGFDALIATSVSAARADLQRDSSLRLVVASWTLSDEDGLALCRWIRRERAANYTYFIVVTKRSSPEAVIEGLASGVDEFLTAPVPPLELLMRLRIGQRILELETRDALIFALAKLAESRDPDTGQHLERVSLYCELLAEDLHERRVDGVDTEFVALVTSTSALHDIGKVGIPDGVLLKPGRLTPDEIAVMRDHTAIGASTLDAALERSPNARFLHVAREIARSHHERWDGEGYPDRLKGDAIPLAARIMSVADVYDALTSRRVYKPALTHEAAAAALREGAGTQFDPLVVESFDRVARKFDEIRARYADRGEAVGELPR